MKLGTIEAGGTKFVIGIGDELGNIEDRITIPTTTPNETINKVIDYFKDKNIEALGVACFGPLDLNEESDTYGYITTTPKQGWGNFNIIGELKKHFNIPMGFDTDVNGSCLGEVKYGAAKGLKSCLYLTIGTGIGAGIYTNGNLIHGLLHPEAGHIILKPLENDTFKGVCPYHEYCFEGMVSGPALEKRLGIKGETIKEDNPVWDLEAHYIAQALMNYIYIVSPEIIILGGGVMHQKGLLEKIQNELIKLNNNYINVKSLKEENIKNYIVAPGLKDDAGIVGGLALAYNAYKKG